MTTETDKVIICSYCDQKFATHKGLHIHKTRLDHWREKPKPIPSPLPIKTTQRIPASLPESRTLLGARRQVELGDKITITGKYVVTKITSTQGSEDLEVEVQKITSSWSKE